MDLRTFFSQVGGDYDEVMNRLPTEGMVKKFLRRFLDDPSCGELEQALAQGDLPTAFRAAHTLKGVGMNLGLGDLARAASELTEQLRGATELPPPQMVQAVERAYHRAAECIGQLCE